MASPQYTGQYTGEQQPQYSAEQPGMQPIQEKTYPQQGVPQQQYPQQPMPQSTYASATPLVSLQQGPAPVDCPMCRVRQMTRVEFVSGGTTQ
jgi:lipopolysaccharide-induced tumor necrosis factor-alpha factor